MLSLGIDIGGTSVKAALLRDGQLDQTARSAPFSRPDTQQLIQAVRQATSAMPSPERIGLCCPGLLDRAQRRITLSVNVPGLVGIPLDDLISRAIDGARAPAAILSDANAVAFDLWALRRLPGRMLSLAVGTGVGAAIVEENGTLLQVTGESPGHLGQIDVSLDDHAPIGPDGGRGSLEAYIGAAALAGKNLDHLTIDDPAIRALARAIRIAHAVYRPQHIALAGGVGIRLKHLIDPLHAAISRNLTSVARPNWSLFCAPHDFHAASGAARFAAALPA